MKKLLIYMCVTAMLLMAALPGLTGCDQHPLISPEEDGILRVVCTVFPGYDFCRVITDGMPEGTVELIFLGRDGKDMHDFEPSAADIVALANADVLVRGGEALEPWAEAALRAAGNDYLRVVSMTDVCCDGTEEAHHDHGHEGHDHRGDEHAWVSLRNAMTIVAAVTETLSQAAPEYKKIFYDNMYFYNAELAALDAAYVQTVAAGVRNTVLIADRYPFAALMEDYGIHCVAAYPGCTAEARASFATPTLLIETVQEHSLPYVFIIDGTDPTHGEGLIATVVTEQTGAQLLRLQSGQVITHADLEAGVYYVTTERDRSVKGYAFGDFEKTRLTAEG